MQAAERLLRMLEAIDDSGQMTTLGNELLQVPAPPPNWPSVESGCRM